MILPSHHLSPPSPLAPLHLHQIGAQVNFDYEADTFPFNPTEAADKSSAEALIAFGKRYLAGEVKAYRKSDAAPGEWTRGTVKTIVYDTFDAGEWAPSVAKCA